MQRSALSSWALAGWPAGCCAANALCGPAMCCLAPPDPPPAFGPPKTGTVAPPHIQLPATLSPSRRVQLTSCTAAMAGMRSRSFCVTATRTVITLAAGPVMRILAMGPSSSTSSSPPPPVPTR